MFWRSGCHWKVYLRTGHEGPELYSSFNLGTRGGGWSLPRSCPFAPGKKTWYPLYRRLSGHQVPSGWVQRISPLPGFDSRTVHPIGSPSIDYTIPAHGYHYHKIINQRREMFAVFMYLSLYISVVVVLYYEEYPGWFLVMLLAILS
jgi:hypothetical protein